MKLAFLCDYLLLNLKNMYGKPLKIVQATRIVLGNDILSTIYFKRWLFNLSCDIGVLNGNFFVPMREAFSVMVIVVIYLFPSCHLLFHRWTLESNGALEPRRSALEEDFEEEEEKEENEQPVDDGLEDGAYEKVCSPLDKKLSFFFFFFLLFFSC